MSPNFSFSYRKICQACDFYLKAKSPPAACIRKGIHTFSKKGGHRVFLHMNSTGPKQTLNYYFKNLDVLFLLPISFFSDTQDGSEPFVSLILWWIPISACDTGFNFERDLLSWMRNHIVSFLDKEHLHLNCYLLWVLQTFLILVADCWKLTILPFDSDNSPI